MPSGVYKRAKFTAEHKANIGAANTTHGRSHSPEYNSWRGMLQRCRKPRATNYRWYGARGINVCDPWLSFVNFLADMGLKPTPEHTIERIDNSKGYTPGNCRWATHAEQMCSRNKPWSLIGDNQMKQQIENLIRTLEAEKKSILKKLELAYQLRDDGQPPPNNLKPAKQVHRGAGFVTLVLSLLQKEGPQSAEKLFKFLRAQPGMRTVTKASFDATLYSEIKKAKPRLRKVTPGVYAAIEPEQAEKPELKPAFVPYVS